MIRSILWAFADVLIVLAGLSIAMFNFIRDSAGRLFLWRKNTGR